MDKEFKSLYETFSKWQVSKLIDHKKMHLKMIKQREDALGEKIGSNALHILHFYEKGFPMLRTSKLVVDVIDYVLEERKTEENANG